MRKDLFAQLEESVREMKAIEAGRLRPVRVTRREDLVSADVDVARLWARFRLSQGKFAALLGINVRTLQNWEQRRGARCRGPIRAATGSPDGRLNAEAPRLQTRGASVVQQ